MKAVICIAPCMAWQFRRGYEKDMVEAFTARGSCVEFDYLQHPPRAIVITPDGDHSVWQNEYIVFNHDGDVMGTYSEDEFEALFITEIINN